MAAIDLLMLNRQMSDNPLYIYNSNGDRMDISTCPMLESQNIGEYMDTIQRKGKAFGRYVYNDILVPRVTAILEYTMGNREFLMQWAARLGPEYTTEKKRVLDVGSKLHEAIAEYLTNGTLYTIQHLRGPIKTEVVNCFRNFLAWYNHIRRIGWRIEVIASEIPLICPWFAGTADLIVDINGKRYVVDFKSSKQITQEYIIQVAIYKWLIENYYPEYGNIDGIGILRFDKQGDRYEDLFFVEDDPFDTRIIHEAQIIFGHALTIFYAMNSFSQDITKSKKEKHRNTGRISKNTKSYRQIKKEAS